MRFLNFTGKIVETPLCIEGEFSWKIRNFLAHTGRYKGGDFYLSPSFYFCDVWWRLRLFPFGETEEASGCLSLYLQPREPLLEIEKATTAFQKIHLHIRVGIKGSDGVGKVVEGEHAFSKFDEEYGFLKFVSRSELEKHRSRLLPGSILTITCVLTKGVPAAACGATLIDVSTQTDNGSKETNTLTGENQLLDKKGIVKVVEDIGKLLVSCENSDVIVQVGGREFKVHSAILSARSPGLWAMIHNENAKNASSNRISINDCDPDVFEEFLHYVYKGSARSLSEKNVFSLYRVAEKYSADDLKLQCLKHIIDKLCIRTFCDALKLAVTRGESGLLELVEHLRSIASSEEWGIFNREYPSEATETLIESLGPPSECKK